jgi:hypothetical protein
METTTKTARAFMSQSGAIHVFSVHYEVEGNWRWTVRKYYSDTSEQVGYNYHDSLEAAQEDLEKIAFLYLNTTPTPNYWKELN